MAQAAYIGTTQGSFDIEAGGSASYRIPIQVPPGTGAMQPALALAYLSGAGGESVIGNGWRLEGLSQITRCPRTVAQDGCPGRVNFDPDDRFSLDGARMQPVQGSYGAPDAIYHTELESWSKVLPVYGSNTPGRSGPDGFRVLERDGRIFEYGGTPDAQLAASPTDPSIRVWALSRVTDRNGNTLTVRYVQDADNSAIYPDRIEYTANEGLQSRRAVSFDYEARPDVLPRFAGGARVAYTRRLTAVRTWLDGKPVRSYTLAYATGLATGRSQLVSVTEADGQGRALPPLLFRWQDGNAGVFDDAHPVPTVSVPAGGEWLPLDVNGDGLVDMVYAASDPLGMLSLRLFVNQGPAGFAAPATLVVRGVGFEAGRALAMDVNADGCIELVYAAPVDWALGLTVIAAVADAAAPGGWSLAVTGTVNGAGPPGLAHGGQLLPMDVNGDGRVDLVYATATDSSIVLRELVSNGTQFTAGPVTSSRNCPPGGRFLPLDFNGDGLTDLVYVREGDAGVRLTLFSSVWGQGLVQQADSPLAASLPLRGGGAFIPFDVNGDGLGDLVYVTQNAAGMLQLYTLLSNGRSFEPAGAGAPQTPGLGFGGTLLPMDVNGDGLCELVVACERGGMVHLDVLAFDGQSWRLLDGVRQVLSGQGWGARLLPLDLGGTGKTGLVCASSDVFATLRCAPPAGPYPDLVVAIENGLQGVVDIDYKPLTDPTVYGRVAARASRLDVGSLLGGFVPGSTCACDPAGGLQAASGGVNHATRSADFPKYVVAQHMLDEGGGKRYAFTRFYTGALIDLEGRGWLGYASVDALDVDAGALHRTEFHQDFPLTGHAAAVRILRADGVLLQEARHGYAAAPPAPWPQSAVSLVRLTRVDTDYFTPGQSAPDRSESQAFGHDDYGNRTTLAEEGTGLPAPLYSFDEYANDPERWLLGLRTAGRRCSDAGGTVVLSAERAAYDERGRVQSRSVWNDAGHGLWLTTTYTYDAWGNPVSETDPSGATATMELDAELQTFVVRSTTPPNAQGLRMTSAHGYDARFGVRTAATDANGVTRTTVYDGLGRATELWGPGPDGQPVQLTTYGWIVADGQTWEETRRRLDWEGRHWSWSRRRLDGFGRAVDTWSLSADGERAVRVDRDLDSRNQCVRETVPYFEGDTPLDMTRSYDALGRMVRMERPVQDGRAVTTITWTGVDRMLQVEAADTPVARKSEFVFGGFGDQRWIVERTGPDGGVTRYDYDALRRRTCVTDPGGMRVERDYDALGRVVGNRQVQGARTYLSATHTYDDVGRSESSGDALGNVVTTTRDALQRVITREVAAPREETWRTDWRYDEAGAFGLGRLAAVTDSRGHYAYAYGYDADGNPASVTLTLDGSDFQTRGSFTPTGMPLEVTLPDGTLQRNDYLPGGGWAGAQLRDGDATLATVAYGGYNAFGQPGTATGGNGCTESLAYNALGQLTGQRIAAPDAALLLDHRFRRDALDQVLAIDDALDARQGQAFGYDVAGRLLSATGPWGRQDHVYDAAGNVVEKGGVAFSYDGHQVVRGTRRGETVYEAGYDAMGRMQRRSWEGEASTLRFDPEGRLLAAGDHSFVYDHTGRRLIKRTPQLTTLYVGEGFERTIFANGATQRTRSLAGAYGVAATSTVLEAGAPPPVPGVPAPGTFYPHADHIASTSLLTAVDGSVAARAHYLPYGEAVLEAGADIFRQKFGGKELDGTGLYQFDARYYDPLTARFVSADDRAGGGLYATDSFNLYAYAGNNPVSRVDPSGHHWWNDWLMGIDSVILTAAGTLLTPFSGALGGALVGAGISGLMYVIGSYARGKDINYGEWVIQVGIGAAVGLFCGGLGRVVSRLMSEVPELEGPGINSWLSRCLSGPALAIRRNTGRLVRALMSGAAGGANGAAGGAMAQALQNEVSSPPPGSDDGMRLSALVGFGAGMAGGFLDRALLEAYGTPIAGGRTNAMYEQQGQRVESQSIGDITEEKHATVRATSFAVAPQASLGEEAPYQYRKEAEGLVYAVKLSTKYTILGTGRGYVWGRQKKLW